MALSMPVVSLAMTILFDIGNVLIHVNVDSFYNRVFGTAEPDPKFIAKVTAGVRCSLLLPTDSASSPGSSAGAKASPQLGTSCRSSPPRCSV